MSTYTGDNIKDLDTSTPTEGATGTIPEFNDAIRETKRVYKYQNAITTITGDTTLDKTYSTVKINKATAIAVTLPTPSTVASAAFIKEYYLQNIGAGVATVNATVTLAGTATVSPTMAQWDEMRIWTDGTTWYGAYLIGNKFSATPAAGIVPVSDSLGLLTGWGTNILSSNVASGMAPSSTMYSCPYGGSTATATESIRQIIIPKNCSIKNLYVKANANTLDVSSVVTLRKNGADTALTITITAGSTAIFSDTTHIVSITAGDILSYSIAIPGGTGALTTVFIGAILTGI